MEFFFLWVAFSVAVGLFASRRGRGGGNWFLFSLVFSPLLGAIFCAVSPDLAKESAEKAAIDLQPSAKTHVKCQKCAEFVLPEASVCKHCASQLTPDPGYTTRMALESKRADDEERSNTIVGWSIIIAVGIVIWVLAR